MLTIEEHIAYWMESAERNLDSAESIFQSGNYDWCLFIGHLVLEKTLKALFIKTTGKTPPPLIHNLLRLSKLSGIELDEETELFFDLVNSFNLETRYEEYKSEFYKIATKEFTETNLNKIKEKFIWLKSLIK
jgi:HEPN domain-containing protein